MKAWFAMSQREITAGRPGKGMWPGWRQPLGLLSWRASGGFREMEKGWADSLWDSVPFNAWPSFR